MKVSITLYNGEYYVSVPPPPIPWRLPLSINVCKPPFPGTWLTSTPEPSGTFFSFLPYLSVFVGTRLSS